MDIYSIQIFKKSIFIRFGSLINRYLFRFIKTKHFSEVLQLEFVSLITYFFNLNVFNIINIFFDTTDIFIDSTFSNIPFTFDIKLFKVTNIASMSENNPNIFVFCALGYSLEWDTWLRKFCRRTSCWQREKKLQEYEGAAGIRRRCSHENAPLQVERPKKSERKAAKEWQSQRNIHIHTHTRLSCA